jgi:hypothetical protein
LHDLAIFFLHSEVSLAKEITPLRADLIFTKRFSSSSGKEILTIFLKVSLLLRMRLLQSSMSDTRRIEAEKVFFVRIKVGCSRIQINWSVHPRYGNRRQQRKSQPASQPELLPCYYYHRCITTTNVRDFKIWPPTNMNL